MPDFLRPRSVGLPAASSSGSKATAHIGQQSGYCILVVFKTRKRFLDGWVFILKNNLTIFISAEARQRGGRGQAWRVLRAARGPLPRVGCAHTQHGGGRTAFPPGMSIPNVAEGKAQFPRPCPYPTWRLLGLGRPRALLALPTGKGASSVE